MVHQGWGENIVISVADIAGSAGWQVRNCFPEGVITVVASGTGTGGDPEMPIAGWLPGSGRVAGVAGLSGRNMCGRLGLSVDSHISTVMTGQALSSGTPVTHPCRCKGNKTTVTRITSPCRRDVIGRLAKRIGAVVTCRTHCDRGRVRIDTGRPSCKGIALVMTTATIALGAGRDMCRRLHLGVLRDVGATMTGRTLTRQARVVH
jgi:hypothetical protein